VLITHTAESHTIRLQRLCGENLNYFGELALISEFHWFFNAHALGDVEILKLSRDSFKKVMERFPETFMDVVAEIVRLRVKRFHNQTDYLIHNMGAEALENLATQFPPGTDRDKR
jgi:CRP-like cAMP-binding protein